MARTSDVLQLGIHDTTRVTKWAARATKKLRRSERTVQDRHLSRNEKAGKGALR